MDKRPANNGTVVLHKFTWARQVCTITPTTGVASVRILHPTLLPGLLHTVRTEDQSERTLHLKHTMLCLGQTQRLMTWGRHRLVMYNTCLPRAAAPDTGCESASCWCSPPPWSFDALSNQSRSSFVRCSLKPIRRCFELLAPTRGSMLPRTRTKIPFVTN